MLEKAFRQSLIMSHGSLVIFMERPIARVFAVIAILLFFLPIVTGYLKRRRLITAFDKIKESASQNN